MIFPLGAILAMLMVAGITSRHQKGLVVMVVVVVIIVAHPSNEYDQSQGEYDQGQHIHQGQTHLEPVSLEHKT